MYYHARMITIKLTLEYLNRTGGEMIINSINDLIDTSDEQVISSVKVKWSGLTAYIVIKNHC